MYLWWNTCENFNNIFNILSITKKKKKKEKREKECKKKEEKEKEKERERKRKKEKEKERSRSNWIEEQCHFHPYFESVAIMR